MSAIKSRLSVQQRVDRLQKLINRDAGHPAQQQAWLQFAIASVLYEIADDIAAIRAALQSKGGKHG